MQAFITGSRRYGTPRPDSDIDVVIGCDSATADKLRAFSEGGLASSDSAYYAGDEVAAVGTRRVSVVKLNLILCDTDEKYEAWLRGTEELVKRAPVNRDQAKAYFSKKYPIMSGY